MKIYWGHMFINQVAFDRISRGHSLVEKNSVSKQRLCLNLEVSSPPSVRHVETQYSDVSAGLHLATLSKRYLG
jgi:hypothetical protein